MKKKVLAAMMAAMALLTGCGDEAAAGGSSQPSIQSIGSITISDATPAPAEDIATPAPTAEPTPEPENREGMYRSELTNEWIDESLKDQRPIAVMVDNEKIALPHYGLTEADIVYEIMNSTKNDRITRFMALVKDWDKIEQFGSIRSTRSTNVYLVGEWNAVLCHDGGPFFALDLIKEKKYCDNFSGTFSRVNNGKAKEFTEYILPGDLETNFQSKKYSIEYNEYYPGPHYTFSDQEFELSDRDKAFDCVEIQLPFKHNESTLKYNEETGTYDYYEYGAAHLDPQHDNAQLTFENLLIQCCDFSELGEGYLVYNVIDNSGTDGYYITNGKAIEVTWYKASDTSPTVYYSKSTGEEIKLNTGKTYISLVPSDSWEDIVIK